MEHLGSFHQYCEPYFVHEFNYLVMVKHSSTDVVLSDIFYCAHKAVGHVIYY